MDNARNLKLIDKIIGTPFCYALGSLAKFGVKKKTKRIANPQKILCIKTVAIGDLVVAMPSFKALKSAFPSAQLTLLTTPRVREVIEGSPFLDEIIYFDPIGKRQGAGIVDIARRLRKTGFDLVVDFEHYYRFTTLLSYLTKAPVRVGFNIRGQGRGGLLTEKVSYPTELHEVEAFLELAKAVGAKADKPALVEITVTREDQRKIDALFNKTGIEDSDLVIGIHATTSAIALGRRWPPERFARLVDELAVENQAKIIFTGAPEDRELVESIRSLMDQASVSTVGRVTLKQFAALTKKIDLFISLDTGPMHIAAAMGARVVGLFGPNTPIKWGPYGKKNQAVYKGLDCSPCTKQYLGQVSNCEKGDCMLAITVDDVKLAANRILSDSIGKDSKAQTK